MMYILDTNILIRFFTGDHPEHSQTALKLVKAAVIENDFSLYIDPVVIAEAIFVLSKVYNIERKDIAEKLERFIDYQGIECDNKEIVRGALGLYAKHNVDFVDVYLAAKSRCTHMKVLTFNAIDFRKTEANWLQPEDVISR